MFLTAENIVHYLTDKNFITPQSVVNGDFTVVDISRRNRNFKIVRKQDKGYFIKQVKNWDAPSIQSLTREAQSYHLLKTDSSFTDLSPLMPKMIHFDSIHNILILELFPQSENLSEMHLRLGTFPINLASQLGTSLGTYHKKIRQNIEKVRSKKIFPELMPWILAINEPLIEQLKSIDENHNKMFSIVQKYPAFMSAIEKLHNEWTVDSLIHGDMKWDNCLVYHEQNNGNVDQLTIKIIDWELSDLGDSAWDVGAIFQTYLSLWVMSLPLSHQSQTEEALLASKYKVENMQPAIKAFWNSYLLTNEIQSQTQNIVLTKCTQYAAIRMIQTVYEQIHFSKQLTYNAIYLLQLSLNMLQEPNAAIKDLFDL